MVDNLQYLINEERILKELNLEGFDPGLLLSMCFLRDERIGYLLHPDRLQFPSGLK